jgi:hypothetical protein
MQNLGHESAEVQVIDGLTEAQYARLALALNKLPEGSTWNDTVLADVLRGLADEEREGLGFSQKELDAILGDGDPLEVKEVETSELNDEFWISVRGPLRHQAAAFKALETACSGLDGVEIDQGTIGLDA